MTTARPWAVMAGGGTGGHVYPGLAVARALVDRGHDPATIRFVGARRGMEASMVPEAGFPVTLLPGRGIARRVSRENVTAVAGIVAAVAAAVVLIGRWRPAVVVSVGGYASVPAVVAAVLWRIPLVVINVDAVPGAANRLAGCFARATAVAFPDTPLPRAQLTGVPVRPQFTAVDRSPAGRRAARASLGLPLDGTVVAVSGGSLGARRLNEAAVELAALWSDRTDAAVYHVVGRRDWDRVREAVGDVEARQNYRAVPYEEAMHLVYGAADLAVQRAGASTVAELCAAGVPSILVPLPASPGDHQTANARAVATAGGTVVIPDGALDGRRLAQEIQRLFDQPAALTTMGEAARGLARPDAANEVARLIEKTAASSSASATVASDVVPGGSPRD